jgi:hypothetical protein
MGSQEVADGMDPELRDRADAAADRAVEAAGLDLTAALDGGNVIEVEQAFYRVFRRIYIDGVKEGRRGR